MARSMWHEAFATQLELLASKVRSMELIVVQQRFDALDDGGCEITLRAHPPETLDAAAAKPDPLQELAEPESTLKQRIAGRPKACPFCASTTVVDAGRRPSDKLPELLCTTCNKSWAPDAPDGG